MCAGCQDAEIHHFHFRGAGGPERFLDTQTGRRETSPPSGMKRVPGSKWQPLWVSQGEFQFPGEGKRGLRATTVGRRRSSLALPLAGWEAEEVSGPASCSVRCRPFRGAPIGTSNLSLSCPKLELRAFQKAPTAGNSRFPPASETRNSKQKSGFLSITRGKDCPPPPSFCSLLISW